MKRLSVAGGAVLLALAPAAPPSQRGDVDIAVVATTDVHGRLRGWDYYADTAEGARGLSRAANTLPLPRVASTRFAHRGCGHRKVPKLLTRLPQDILCLCIDLLTGS